MTRRTELALERHCSPFCATNDPEVADIRATGLAWQRDRLASGLLAGASLVVGVALLLVDRQREARRLHLAGDRVFIHF